MSDLGPWRRQEGRKQTEQAVKGFIGFIFWRTRRGRGFGVRPRVRERAGGCRATRGPHSRFRRWM